jgi:hypothetical protein
MLSSNEKMSFINEYMNAYKEKISMANKYGLFDAAKMFELFAIEVCKLLFGQKFINLNIEESTYPYVDLISEDKQLFVQVSTSQDVPKKIKTTLENIRDSKDERFSALNRVIFFVITNDSVDKVKDYNGDKQIGKISFTKKEDLITTRDIINRAENDIAFLNSLYNILKLEFDRFNESVEKLNEAIHFCKSTGLKNINGLINGEYEIDRSTLVKKIKEDNAKFVTIMGRAGSGKSALCKKIVENEDVVLYARAESFVAATDINGIWKCDIKAVLEYLNGKKIVFFIDALEFIADCSDTKFELLQYLYEIVRNYENAYILTSCRTSDKSAFMKLESNFAIKPYEIDDLSINELILIMEKYPVIQRMYEMKSYSDLLKSPFYINMIVSRKMDIDDIGDESSFREYIWTKVICLQEKKKIYRVTYQEAAEAITKIVFERAKKFSLGVPEDEINSNIVEALISEDIIIMQGHENIRLKYDIFEDICFEHYFDKEFNECKGEYRIFYDEIEQLGRCVYRRYQIWISNKLFIKSNRDKFLSCLVFSADISHEWKRQTEIGIVKSRFCNSFFEEYGMDIVDSEVLLEFVKITNLFAFEARIVTKKEKPQMLLMPIGNGRSCMIKIIESEQLYKKDIINKEDIIKLCKDYARQNNRENHASLAACSIMEHYIEIAEKSEKYYNFIDSAKPCLEAIYQMADVSNKWIKEFWNRLIDDYKSNEIRKRIAKDTMEWTLRNAYPALIKIMTKEICLVADEFWLDSNKESEDYRFYSNRLNEDKEYGLSESAEYYNSSYRNVNQNVFLRNLFGLNFKEGFQWAIQFVNKAISEYAANNPNKTTKIKILFVDNQTEQEYLGNGNMWMAGIMENSVPVLIGDIIFCLRDEIINCLEFVKQDKELMIAFANYIKKTLYSDSNNIALLSIIEAIGFHFEWDLPGYSLDLITNMSIIHWDVQRYILYIKNPARDMLEKRILMSVGLPNIKKRYEIDKKCNKSIQQYISNTQLYFDSTVKDKCYKILDFLYSITTNDKENAVDYLQIQKMDLRGAKEIPISDSVIALEPNITGAAEEIIQEQEKADEPLKELEQILKKCAENISDGEADLNLVFTAIETVLKIMNASNLPAQYEDVLIKLIAIALKSKKMEPEERTVLCEMWIDGVKKFISHEGFIFNLNLFPCLLRQLDFDISSEIKNELKMLVIRCLMYTGQDGSVDKLTISIKKYLLVNKKLAQAVFYTIIKLAEDEMNHQKYNANFIKTHEGYKDFVYVPNMQPRLSWADRDIKNEGAESYDSQREAIFTKYLFEEENIQIEEFDINNYDISTLCYVANCGLNFDNEFFEKVIHSVLTCMVDIWKYHDRDYDGHKIVDTFQEQELVELYRREVIEASGDAKTVIDTLFNDIDFSRFTSEAVEFYKDIFGNFLPEFFDAYVDPKRRNRCKKKILYIEQKVVAIDVENVRLQLYQSLMFSVTRYCCGDWSKCRTTYSFTDKQFLNEQFSKYGKYHVVKLLETIYQLRIDELLPEILISIRNSFRDAKTESTKFARDIQEQKGIVNMIILKSFVRCSDMIKEDQELITAYQDILEILIDLNYEEAAVILDEFRVH